MRHINKVTAKELTPIIQSSQAYLQPAAQSLRRQGERRRIFVVNSNRMFQFVNTYLCHKCHRRPARPAAAAALHHRREDPRSWPHQARALKQKES